jgi:hypothetical protein
MLLDRDIYYVAPFSDVVEFKILWCVAKIKSHPSLKVWRWGREKYNRGRREKKEK